MKHIEIAKSLLVWNTRNLVKSAELKKSELGIYFADQFLVKANGINYDANHDKYFDFLNQFRSTIRSISYDYHDFIADRENVVIPMIAHIIRLDGSLENFEAILILKFDKSDKIVLWHEVYVMTS